MSSWWNSAAFDELPTDGLCDGVMQHELHPKDTVDQEGQEAAAEGAVGDEERGQAADIAADDSAAFERRRVARLCAPSSLVMKWLASKKLPVATRTSWYL